MAIPNAAMDTTAKQRRYGIGILLILLQLLPLLGSAQCAGLSKWGDTPDSMVERARNLKNDQRFLEAIELFNCALKGQQDSLPEGDAFFSDNYHRLGFCYSRIGYIQEAVTAYQTCLSHLENRDSLDIRAHRKYADVLNAIGTEYSKLAQFDKAAVYCRQAVDSTIKYYGESNPDAIDVLVTTSEVLRLFDQTSAFIVAKRAMTAAKQMQPVRPNSFVGATGTLSGQFLDQGQIDSASYYLDLSKPYFSKATPEFQSEILQNTGDCLIKQGKVREGIAQYELAIYMGDTNPNQSLRDQGRLYVRFGEVLKGARRYDEALVYLQCALMDFVSQFTETAVSENPKAELWSMEPQLFEVFRHKAGCFAGIGRLDDAFTNYNLAFEFLDYLRKGFNTSGSRNLIARFAFPYYEEPIQLAVDKYHTTHDIMFLNLAFQYMEQSKTNEILESLQEMELSTVDPERIHRYRNMRNKIAQLNDDPNENSERIHSLHRSIEVLYDSLFPMTFALRESSMKAPETPQTIQASLKQNPDQLFLEYFLGDSTLFIFAIDNSHYDCFQVPIKPEFNIAVTELMGSLHYSTNHAKSDWEEFAPYASYLYAQLIGPIIVGNFTRRIPKLLTIIPDGRLALLPFECLLASPKHSNLPFMHADYLGRFCAVRYGQSATTLKAQRRGKLERDLGGLLAIAASPEKLRKLEGVDDEAKFAADAIEPSKILLDEEATSANLSAEARNYRILHLACHAEADTSRAMHSWLALQGKNGSIDTLFAHEISNDTLDAEMVVLSACETGTGKLQSGEGVMSLARSFQMAGCRTTVMSLWKLDDKSTGEIMEPFYEHIAVGKTASESMLHARQAYFNSKWLADNTRFAHPHYWAAMVTVGEDGPHLPQSEIAWLKVFIWGSIGAAIIAFWQRRRRRRKRKTAFRAA